MNNGDMPARPTPIQHDDWREDYAGMTLREHFAGLAMQATITEFFANTNGGFPSYEDVARNAVKYSDALLEALEKSND